MARTCTVCRHPEREAIDRELVAGAPYRSIAKQYSLGEPSVERHRTSHLLDAVLVADEAKEEARSLDLMAEISSQFAFMNKLARACDEWLTDANDPGKYDIGPRAREIVVHYDASDPANLEAKTKKTRATLSALLAMVDGLPGIAVDHIETRYADPRELVVKAARQLTKQCEFLARLQGKLDGDRGVGIGFAADLARTQTAIMNALAPFPEARAAVVAALQDLVS